MCKKKVQDTKVREGGREGENTSNENGVVAVAYLFMTFPFLSTRNLVKFHLILEPNKPGLLAFKNL
jgi:hypothetical protein